MAKRPAAKGVNGLRLNVVRGPHKADKRVWYWRIIDNRGGRVTLWSGWATAQDAEAELARLAAPGATRPERGEDAGPDITTIEQLLRAWRAHLEDDRPDLAPGTLGSYRTAARRITGLIGSVLIERLDVAAVERWVADAQRRWAASTVTLDQVTLRAAWNWGRKRGVCPDQALPRIEIRIPRRVKRTPSPSEVARVLEHVRVPWVRVLLTLQWATGARIGEIGSLTWDRVDWDRGELELRGKTGPRLVPLAPDMLQMLRRWRLESPSDRDEVLGVALTTARSSSYSVLEEACEAADVPMWSTHALRRAVVDRLARAGVDVATAADLLGHTPETMLSAYRQVSDEDRRRAVARARLGTLPVGQVIEADFGGEGGG